MQMECPCESKHFLTMLRKGGSNVSPKSLLPLNALGREWKKILEDPLSQRLRDNGRRVLHCMQCSFPPPRKHNKLSRLLHLVSRR